MSPHGPRMVGRSSIGGLPEPDERLRQGLRALKGLGPYLWPRDSLELRARIVLALLLLVAGKLVNIAVPLFYKHAVDALTAPNPGAISLTLGTIVLYIAFTFMVTDWRIRFRREMNTRNSEANTKSVDSLLNYETVKYFANEAHEAERYDRALHAYERAAVKSETTLAVLNVGQGAIIASGLIGIMLLAGQGVAAGAMTVGDFVLVSTYLIPLYMPLNFLGLHY